MSDTEKAALRELVAVQREALNASQALVHAHELGTTPHPSRRSALDIALDRVMHATVELERLDRSKELAA